MNVDKETILAALPPFKNEWVTLMHRQQVPDIIAAVFDSHRKFKSDYEKIGSFFQGSSIQSTCENLYQFCKKYIHYREESEDWQSTAVPQGVLTRGYGDCKHYAMFAAGCLAAMEQQTGEPIDWEYCFASYKWDQTTPYHVFVIVTCDDGSEVWIDPTPGAAGKVPVWWFRKKV